MKVYYTYILSSLGGTLYTGVTNDIWRRVFEHKHKVHPGFTSKYDVNCLVYYEESNSISEATYREKQIKAWTRAEKIRLIESMNPKWKDLAADWYDDS